jgi:hypothetical protein
MTEMTPQEVIAMLAARMVNWKPFDYDEDNYTGIWPVYEEDAEDDDPVVRRDH